MAIYVQRIMQTRDHLTLTALFASILKGSFFNIPKIYFIGALAAFFLFKGRIEIIPLAFLLIAFLWLVAGIPIKAFYYKNRIVPEILREADDSFSKFIGKPVKYKDVEIGFTNTKSGQFSGYGLAYDDKTVYVMQHGLAAKIPWSDVREWSWNIEGYSETTFYGGSPSTNLHANYQATMSNNRAKWGAHMKSGFFITVADIQHPSWHFMSVDQNVLKKWMEIFNQVKENKL